MIAPIICYTLLAAVECACHSARVPCCECAQGAGWFNETSASLLGTAVTAIGFIVAIWQLYRGDKILQGDLALKLDERMNSHRPIYRELFSSGMCYQEIPKDKIEEVEYYMTFYDTASILVKNKQIKIAQFNQLYGFRFMCLMHNPTVQAIVNRFPKSWIGLTWLYRKVLAMRKKEGSEIDRLENAIHEPDA
jgi:hypothetical protein